MNGLKRNWKYILGVVFISLVNGAVIGALTFVAIHFITKFW